MSRTFPPGEPSRAAEEAGEHGFCDSRVSERGDDAAARHVAGIQRMYDTALARSAVGGDRSLQRYLAVLIASPRSA